MKKMQLTGSIVVENQVKEPIYLDYYLVESYAKEREYPLFGILIEKAIVNEGQKKIVETNLTEGISFSGEMVLQMLELLKHHAITPMCADEVIDEWMTVQINYAVGG